MTNLLEKSIPGSVRSAAEERAGKLEWPTPRDEEWRRTDISEFRFDSYDPYPKTGIPQSSVNVSAPEHSVGRPLLAYEEGHASVEVFFADGRVDYYRFDDAFGQSGIEISSIGEETDPPLTELEPMLLHTISKTQNRLEAWQFQGAQHGIVVRVPDGVRLEKPIYLYFDETQEGILSKPNLIVVLGKDASISIARVIHTAENGILLSPGIVAGLGDGANLELVVVDDFGPNTAGFSYAAIDAGRDSQTRYITAGIGGAPAKSRVTVTLGGPGSEARIDGVYLAGDGEHLDLKSVQEHLAPNTMSRSYFKGAVQGSGRTIYQGLIDVNHGARNTDAYLANKNLVLNDGARADSIPSLKIRTNDVKCSHGSTTGRIDQEQVFYLMNRGFTRLQAENAIIEGYFEDALKTLDPSLRTAVVSAMVRRLRENGDAPVPGDTD